MTCLRNVNKTLDFALKIAPLQSVILVVTGLSQEEGVQPLRDGIFEAPLSKLRRSELNREQKQFGRAHVEEIEPRPDNLIESGRISAFELASSSACPIHVAAQFCCSPAFNASLLFLF